MKILCFSDLQISGNDTDFDQPNGSTSMMKSAWSTLEWISYLVRDYPVDAVACLGDIGDDHTTISIPAMNLISRGFEGINQQCKSKSIPFIVVAGNHDKCSKNGEMSIADMLIGRGIHVASSSPTVVEVREAKVACLPYYDDLDVFYAEYAKVVTDPNVWIVVFHQDIIGASYGGTVCKSGIDPERLDKSRMHLVGHIHNYTSLAPHVRCIGSSMYHNFGEDYFTDPYHGPVIYDTESMQIERISNTFTPLYTTIDVKSEDDLLKISALNSDMKIRDRMKVRVNIVPELFGKIDRTALNFLLYREVPIKVEKTVNRLDISKDSTDTDILSKYCEARGIASTAKDLASSILAEATAKVKKVDRKGKKIAFQSISIEGFLSIGKVDLTLQDLGMVLIEGRNMDADHCKSNGAGKSSIFEAIYWTLYGTTIRGSNFDKVVNTRYPQGTCVVLTLTVDQDIVQITRTRNHRVQGTRIQILVNGNDATPSVNKGKAIDDKVVDIVGLSPTMFSSLVYYGQGFPSPFSTWSDKDKYGVIEEMIESEVYDLAFKIVKDRSDAVVVEKTSIENAILVNDRVLQQSVEDVKSIAVRMKEEETKKKGQIEDLSRIIEDCQKKVGPVRDSIESLNKDISGLSTIRMDMSNDLRKVQEEVSSVRSKISSIQTQIRTMQNTVDSMERIGPSCPTCKQAVSAEYKSMYTTPVLEEIKKLKGQEADLQGTVSSYDRQSAEISSKISEVDQQVRVKQSQLYPLSVEEGKLKSDIQTYKAEIEDIQSAKSDLADLLQETKKKIARMIEETKVYKGRIVSLDTSLADLSTIQEAFSPKGLRSYRLDSVLSVVNTALARYCYDLFDNNITVQLNPEKTLQSGDKRNSIQLDIESPGSSYINHSGGEKRDIDIAIHMALRDVVSKVTGASCNVLMVDECIDFLDDTATSRIMEVFSSKLSEIPTILFITHRDSLKSRFSRVMTITKKDGLSSVS